MKYVIDGEEIAAAIAEYVCRKSGLTGKLATRVALNCDPVAKTGRNFSAEVTVEIMNDEETDSPK